MNVFVLKTAHLPLIIEDVLEQNNGAEDLGWDSALAQVLLFT